MHSLPVLPPGSAAIARRASQTAVYAATSIGPFLSMLEGSSWHRVYSGGAGAVGWGSCPSVRQLCTIHTPVEYWALLDEEALRLPGERLP